MEKSLLFVCESGISASLFVSKILENIRDKGLNYDVDYAPVMRVEEKLNFKNYEFILLSPQVHRYEAELRELLLKVKCTSKIIGITADEFMTMNIEKIMSRLE
ncbi:PTS cellobiose transporter subunit IIC [Vagococcus salmoninarum]|uniref:PTS cellobiose transporter subunit IIC n=1 Tax=Vagococcus salmoninarum TaxID=2739 RepID=A0A429ZJZ9_9ENTE|nr:PTS cellobiose transporter subunit IIC [Vagococcus salmoninarum]MBE9389987.1 PTS cellobiose transporter subunit IIC [Vagococcus salmoninarum]RST94028.1 PTS cellobiose transporter subunit IIC [Vagococcus salmoninarum]